MLHPSGTGRKRIAAISARAIGAYVILGTRKPTVQKRPQFCQLISAFNLQMNTAGLPAWYISTMHKILYVRLFPVQINEQTGRHAASEKLLQVTRQALAILGKLICIGRAERAWLPMNWLSMNWLSMPASPTLITAD